MGIGKKISTEAPEKSEIGTPTADGWIYAGISVDTGKPFYVAPDDAGLMNWQDAMKTLNLERTPPKKNWLGGLFGSAGIPARTDVRLPSKGELSQIFENEAKIGGFKKTGGPKHYDWSVDRTKIKESAMYWSSEEYFAPVSGDELRERLAGKTSIFQISAADFKSDHSSVVGAQCFKHGDYVEFYPKNYLANVRFVRS